MMSTRRRSATRQATSCGSRIAAAVSRRPSRSTRSCCNSTSRRTRRPTLLGDLDIAGGRLAELLAAIAARGPTGTRVDVYAHSQGGLVVLVALADLANDDPSALARLGVVVTLASPFHGAELAGLAEAVARPPIGTPLLNAVGGLAGTDLPRRRPGNRPARARIRPGRRIAAQGLPAGRGSFRSRRRVTPWCRHRMRISMAPPTSSSP